MLLTISTNHSTATDLGFLLHKHPDRVQSFELSFGFAHVFYPRADASRCTFAMLLDVDPVHLVRRRRGPSGEGFLLEQYVNDRPYVASSFLSVAISRVLGSAMGGRCEARPALVSQAIPITAELAAVRCQGGDSLVRRLFEPLDYQVTTTRQPLDETFPGWGDSPYFSLRLETSALLSDLLSHLYVLIPVLDDQKHYWVSDEEVTKLLEHGRGWLAAHPDRDTITQRYLRHLPSLARSALAQLREEHGVESTDDEVRTESEELSVERPLRLHDLRIERVVEVISKLKARSVIDLGCGEGILLRRLLKDKGFERIVGMDVSHRALEVAAERLNLDRLPPKVRERIELIQGSLMYRDDRIAGFDAAVVVEVIEHLDPPRLAAFERVVFECARPKSVVLTTPNVEYNVLFPTLPAGRFRHRDHRFEWTRSEFRNWCEDVARRFDYDLEIEPIGDEDAAVGAPTQLGVFRRQGKSD